MIKEESEAAICLSCNLVHHHKINENSFSALIQSNFSGPPRQVTGTVSLHPHKSAGPEVQGSGKVQAGRESLSLRSLPGVT